MVDEIKIESCISRCHRLQNEKKCLNYAKQVKAGNKEKAGFFNSQIGRHDFGAVGKEEGPLRKKTNWKKKMLWFRQMCIGSKISRMSPWQLSPSQILHFTLKQSLSESVQCLAQWGLGKGTAIIENWLGGCAGGEKRDKWAAEKH